MVRPPRGKGEVEGTGDERKKKYNVALLRFNSYRYLFLVVFRASFLTRELYMLLLMTLYDNRYPSTGDGAYKESAVCLGI